MPDLQTILQYRNENIISRFCDQFDITEEEAEDIFTETKKFIYLALHPGVFIPNELLIIDEMWHNFILFTQEYHEFSHSNFQRYVHHKPATKAEKLTQQLLQQQDPEGTAQLYLQKFEKLVTVTFDILGEETTEKWYELYPDKYSRDNIKKLRKN